MKVDVFTLDKVRFDYAHVLISTSSLDIIKSAAMVMVVGSIFEFQFIEEWGFSLGEDACLGDDEESQADDDVGDDGGLDDLAVSGMLITC